MKTEILRGDCLEIMATMPAESVDAIVTDPPYGLGFMGKKWDALPPGQDWAEHCLRVLKPGGHLLAFGGSRTYHRLAVAVEDAGFEIRDQIMWLYGSGFPKSLDVSKAIDKAQGAEGEYGEPKSAAHAGWIDRGAMRGSEGHDGYQRPWMKDPDAVDNAARKYLPGSPDARRWSGWGTALKPAHEPVVVARKPLIGTVAQNVERFGVGGLNIDGCRVGTEKVSTHSRGSNAAFPKRPGEKTAEESGRKKDQREGLAVGEERTGRWPANLVLDEQAGAMLDAQSGATPSRFFYCAKANKKERNAGAENKHPTVKPIAVMRWLVRLVTPPGGTVLDPFVGSGTTGIAAGLEGFEFIGIEREEEYADLAEARIEHWSENE